MLAAGACLTLPEGFTGQVLSRQQWQVPTDEAADVWQATQRFGALHYWNHDAHPAAMDGVPRVLEWLAAAKAVRYSERHGFFMHLLTAITSKAGMARGAVQLSSVSANTAMHDCALLLADGGACLSRSIGEGDAGSGILSVTGSQT